MVYTFYTTYAPFESLHLEFAGNHSQTQQFGENTQRRGLLDWYLEVNRTLPNGEANPPEIPIAPLVGGWCDRGPPIVRVVNA